MATSNSTRDNTPVKGVTPLKWMPSARKTQSESFYWLAVGLKKESSMLRSWRVAHLGAFCLALNGSYTPSEIESLGGKAIRPRTGKGPLGSTTPHLQYCLIVMPQPLPLKIPAAHSTKKKSFPILFWLLSKHLLGYVATGCAYVKQFWKNFQKGWSNAWDHCRDGLETWLGVEYVHRRASDKRSLLDAVLCALNNCTQCNTLRHYSMLHIINC